MIIFMDNSIINKFIRCPIHAHTHTHSGSFTKNYFSYLLLPRFGAMHLMCIKVYAYFMNAFVSPVFKLCNYDDVDGDVDGPLWQFLDGSIHTEIDFGVSYYAVCCGNTHLFMYVRCTWANRHSFPVHCCLQSNFIGIGMSIVFSNSWTLCQ